MINPIWRTLTLRRDETGPAVLLFFYLFFAMGAYLMGQAVGDALFLQEFPRRLPYAMMGSALMAGAFVAVWARLSTRMRLESVIIASLIFFSLSFALFWWLTRFEVKWVYWLILIWVYTAGAICPMMGWTIANSIMTTRAARRLFGYIGAGALLGGAVVSFSSADMVHHGKIAPQTVLLAVACMIGFCALLVRLLFRNAGARMADFHSSPAAGAGAPKSFRDSFHQIRGSRYLLMLTALVAAGCLATSILGYQFKLISKDAFGNSTEGLAAYFCRFNGYMGLASFIFQLALTPMLLTTFGIRVTLFVTPLALMASSFGVLAAPTLLTASILRGSHYMLRFSLDKSSTELLYVPVSAESRSQVKSFIDTFVWRSADGVAGIILCLFTDIWNLTPSEVSLVNLVPLAGWIYIANQVRREYLNVLRQAIERRTLDPEKTAAQVLDSTTIEVLAHALERGGEQQLMYGMSLFEMSRQKGWHPALRRLLEHGSPSIRVQALRLLGDAGAGEILPHIGKLLGDESLEVRAEALRYLVVHEGRDPLTVLTEDSKLPPHVIQGAVVTYLTRENGQEYASAAELILDGMLNQTGPDAPRARCEAARVLGLIPPPSESHSRLRRLFDDNDPDVLEQAILSAGKCRIPEFLPDIIAMLARPRLAAAARAALVQYDSKAVGMLRSQLNDTTVPMTVRKQIPRTLAGIPAPESAAALAHSLVQRDPGLRFDVLKALNKMRELHPDLLPHDADYTDLVNVELIGCYRSIQILAALDRPFPADYVHGSVRLLKRACREHMDQERERIFRLLALSHPPRDVHNAYVGLASRHASLQSNALEVLDHLLPPDLFRRLAGVLDVDADPQRKLDYALHYCGTEVPSRIEALRILLSAEDSWLRACAFYATGGLRLTELRHDLALAQCGSDPLLAETRGWALDRLAFKTRT